MFCFTKPFKVLYSSWSSPSTAVTADFSVSPVKPTPLAPTLTDSASVIPRKGIWNVEFPFSQTPCSKTCGLYQEDPSGLPAASAALRCRAQKGTEGSSRAQSGSPSDTFLCIFLESRVSSGSLDEMAPVLWPSPSLSQRGISAQILFNLQVKASEFTILADAFLLPKERHTRVRMLSSSSGGTAMTDS